MITVKHKLIGGVKTKMTTFAKARDYESKIHYLAADTEREIEDYCENWMPNGVSSIQMEMFDDGDQGLVVEQYIYDHTVFVAEVQKEFDWVGRRRNPFALTKPFKYGKK